jgi:hypothetical protein
MYRMIFSVIVNVKVTECKRKRLSSDSDSEKTSDESDDSSNTRNAGATKWAKEDKTPI